MNCDPQLCEPSITIFGYCHSSATQISKLVVSGRARNVVHLGGNFVIVAKQGSEVWVITSPYGAVAYFYSLGPTWFSYGATVTEVLQGCDIEWRWNVKALADLFALEHLVGCDTLHAGVKRTPAASVLHWDGRKLEEWTATWTEIHSSWEASGSPDRLVDTLCDEIERCAGSTPILSASGGFDSRVLLAALLTRGRKPELVVQGYANSTDRVVVEAIGREFGLKVRAVELTTDDYLNSAQKICRATSGTKPAGHWHTYIYTAKSGLSRDNNFFVGANGEFARTYFLDKGILSLTANCLPPSIALREFWRRRIKPVLFGGDFLNMTGEFADYLRNGTKEQVRRLVDARPGGSTLHQLDHFYLEERVRHFIGNGLALYGLSAEWRTPFLSVPWVAEVEKLPRRWKIGNNWHRYAIERLCSKLLHFPEDHVGPVMAKRHAPLYWLPSHRQQKIVPYVDYKKIFSDQRIQSLLLDNARGLEGFMTEDAIAKIVEQHRSSGQRQRAISILLGLALWSSDARSRRDSKMAEQTRTG